MIRKNLLLMLGLCALLTFSCDEDEADPPAKVSVQTFDIDLDNAYSIPMVEGRDETGNIKMNLFDDNSLEFTITINNLLATATGTITLSDSEIATLKGSDVYVNVHSTDKGSGLVRGQIDQTIDNAFNVALSPANEVPAITDRNESGAAYLRVIGTTLYYSAVVNDLDATDAITAGHIHNGSAEVNGGVLVNLGFTDNAQLGITKSLTLTDAELTALKNDPLYVNIHSVQHGGGLLRGQIR